MKKFAFIGIAVIVLLIAGLLILPSLIPSSVYKEKIETQLTRELGRDVAVIGDVKLSVFPTIKAKAGRVEIKNPAGFSDEYFATMDGLNAGVKLFPLFSKRVEISSFGLKSPMISLEKNSQGVANWVFGDKEEGVPVIEDTGPFKRDGRYKEVDPNIGKFSLENGKIFYNDRVENVSHVLSGVNIDFKLPSLSSPLKLDGNLIYNDVPLDIVLSLDSIRGFLDGKVAPLSLDLKTDFATLSAKGEFLAGQEIGVVVDADGSVKDAARLVALIPNDIPNADLVTSGKFSGTYRFENGILSAQNAKVDVKGDALNAAFSGNAKLSEPPVLDGNVQFETTQAARLAKIFAPDVKGAELAESVNVKADFSAQDKGFLAQNIEALVKGKNLDMRYTGRGEFGDVMSTNGRINLRAENVADIVKALELDVPQAAAIGKVSLQGNVSMLDKAISLKEIDLEVTDGLLNADYTGEVSLGDTQSYKGQFSGSLTSLSEFARVTQTEIPYADAIGEMVVSGTLNGVGEDISVDGLKATLSGGQINGQYQGSVKMKDGVSLLGQLEADIPSLRKLAAITGTELPPSTSAGNIYERFTIKGNVNGTPDRIKFEQAELSIDNISGNGDFNVDMTGTKPYATGKLDLAGLDLRPYMSAYSAQKPTGGIQPWSETPINLEPLRAVDADLSFSTPNIILERLSIGQSEASVTVKDGVLSANAPDIALYGGSGYLKTVLNGSGPQAAISFDAGLNALNSNKFLQAVAGFANATGEGKSIVKVSASGASQAAIMRSLSGQGDFSIRNGEISGVDLTQLLTGLDQALKSRSLPSGVGAQYVTKFQDLGGAFSVDQGVVSVGDFALEGLGIAALGGGKIDLGNQQIDFNLRPKLTSGSASALGSYGIPLNIKGGFGNVSVSLDTDFLGKIVADQARAKAQDLIKDQVGGQAGNILGSIIGGGTPSSESGATPPQTTEQAIGGLLGGLIKKEQKTETTPQSGTETPKTETAQETEKAEEKVEDQILNLFKKKKTSN